MAFLTDVESAMSAKILATGFDKFDENNPSAKYLPKEVHADEGN